MTDNSRDGRTLVLLRHAQAEQSPESSDAERPLTKRGHADAAAAGAWLARHGYLPDLVICSPARRTRQTWHGVALGMTGSPPEGGSAGPAPVVRYEPAAYSATAPELLALAQAADPTAKSILLISHNPGISLLSALLDRVRANSDGMGTSGIVVHQTPVAWSALGTGQAPITRQHTARG